MNAKKAQAKKATKTSAISALKYNRALKSDNPRWREGGDNKRTISSLKKDVQTHKHLVDSVGRTPGGAYSGFSISSIDRLRGERSRGGK